MAVKSFKDLVIQTLQTELVGARIELRDAQQENELWRAIFGRLIMDDAEVGYATEPIPFITPEIAGYVLTGEAIHV